MSNHNRRRVRTFRVTNRPFIFGILRGRLRVLRDQRSRRRERRAISFRNLRRRVASARRFRFPVGLDVRAPRNFWRRPNSTAIDLAQGRRLIGSVTRTDATRGNVRTETTTQLVKRQTEKFARSRNVRVIAKNLKPFTQFYQFIDKKSGVDFIPKLIEISNSKSLQNYGAKGSFEIGETVVGTIGGEELIRFRITDPRHKRGKLSKPKRFYKENPYVRGEQLPKSYSQSSKVLNVDISGLSRLSQGEYFGYIQKGMKLTGQTSGARAFVKDIRLISDSEGDLYGSFFIKNPRSKPAPSVRLRTGTLEYLLTSNSSGNTDIGEGDDLSISFGRENYATLGISEVYSRQIVRTRTVVRRRPRPRPRRRDPLAQTFSVGGNVRVPTNIDTTEDVEGAFITSVDLFFSTIDPGNAPLIVEIRTVELGIPTLDVIGKPAVVYPRSVDEDGNEVENIIVSSTGEIATNIKFPEPIYLAPGQEYALVIISENSDRYEVWTAVMGEKTVDTQSLPDVDAVRHSQQWALGSLYKSQNGSVWTTNQLEDLKFKFYKAEFTPSSGTAYFYNPTLDRSNGYVSRLEENPIFTFTKSGRIGITTVTDSGDVGILTVGRKIPGGNGNNGSAIIVGTGSSVSGITTTNAGVNYPASLTSKVVDTFSILGDGKNLKLVIDTDADGVITGAASSTESGNGYQVGDVVGIITATTSATSPTGRNAEFTITNITGVDTLFLANVQGEFGGSGDGHEFSVGVAVSYFNGSTITALSAGPYSILSSEGDGDIFNGRSIRVSHPDHGLYSTTNRAKMFGIKSDQPTTVLSSDLSADETTSISVEDGSVFGTFEGATVSGTYPGYVKIGREVIKYVAVSGNVLTLDSSSRGIDNTIPNDHFTGDKVQKYEVSGVSLRRINNQGLLIDSLGQGEIDSYVVKINRSTNGNDRSNDGSTAGLPQLNFTSDSFVGGNKVFSSENVLFGSVIPSIDFDAPSNTSVSGKIRTITGTSVGGEEIPYNDMGYQDIELQNINSFEDLRMIAAKQNENNYLTNLPRKKSLTTALTFNRGENKYISPILYLDSTVSLTLISNRLNNPIENYANDGDVNTILDDPHTAVYYSNPVFLENPADSLKVFLSAMVPSTSDFRVLYSLIREDSSEVEQSFELFPGFDNLKLTSSGLTVIDPAKNSGLPDDFVEERPNEFLDYEFTANNLGLFNGFIIKIVMSGTSQAESPMFSDIRAIATK